MYNSIKSCIVYNKSDFFSSEVGVRQGDNLSPFLFAVFLNDLEQFMEDKNITGLESISSELEAQLEIYLNIFALLYADDTVLMSETSDGLQTLLNNFYTAGNRHKQNSWFCKEIREDNFRFWWRRVHEYASQGMYMSKIEIFFFTARILQNQRMLCCGECFHD
jgi:hypothetical protein